jgi:hypothetical protein
VDEGKSGGSTVVLQELEGSSANRWLYPTPTCSLISGRAAPPHTAVSARLPGALRLSSVNKELLLIAAYSSDIDSQSPPKRRKIQQPEVLAREEKQASEMRTQVFFLAFALLAVVARSSSRHHHHAHVQTNKGNSKLLSVLGLLLW